MSDFVASRRNYNERKVRTLFVTKEMFIIRLDRPWLDTPFWLQGFLLKTDEELKALNKYCDYVYIDINRGVEAEFYMEEDLQLPSNDYLEEYLRKKKKRKKIKYRTKTCLKDELIASKDILEKATIKYVLMMQSVRKGEELNMSAVQELIEPMLESIVRNPEALILLSRLRRKKEYTFSHSIDACALSILFGRHMGLPIKNLRTLAAGVLLFDIGKLKIEDSILNKSDQLSDEEFRKVNRHVDYGIDILNKAEGVDPDVFNIVLTHHERFDGSGYPNGLSGTDIPVYGRMAAIIDCYDAMTSFRPFSSSDDPYKALQQIYGWRNTLFQSELVEQFLQCMGVYPNGSLVELNSGEVAVVIAQNEDQKLKPKIIPVINESKQACKDIDVIDLSRDKMTRSGRVLTIIKDVNADDLGINTEMIYEKISLVIPKENVPGMSFAEKINNKFRGFIN